MYFIAKKDDKKMAVKGLVLGIIVSSIFITILQVGLSE